MDLGSIIRRKRIDRKLTQKKLAEELGVTPSAVNKWEHGSSTPDSQMLLPLSKVLEIPIEDLIGALNQNAETIASDHMHMQIRKEEYFFDVLETVTDGFFLVDNWTTGVKPTFISAKGKERIGEQGQYLSRKQLHHLIDEGTLHLETMRENQLQILEIRKLPVLNDESNFLGVITDRSESIINLENALFESRLRSAMTSNAVLSVFYDLNTGNRIHHDNDVVPASAGNVETIREFISVFLRCIHKDDMLEVVTDSDFIIAPEAMCSLNKKRSFTCRMLKHLKEGDSYYWFRFFYTYLDGGRSGHRIFYIIAIPTGADMESVQSFGRPQAQESKPPELEKEKFVRINTFGYFEVFVDGKPIAFASKKAKELLALLVDRHGGYVSAEEAIACLWEEEPDSERIRGRYRRAAMEMNHTLQKYGISQIVELNRRKRRIVPEAIHCDYFAFLDGDSRERCYKGEYMKNYSWAESTKAKLEWNA